MKTLDIIAKEWFDKVNGNSYFAARVTIDYGTDRQEEIVIPFQYGYGSAYQDMAKEALVKRDDLPLKDGPLSLVCRDLGIILRKYKIENCKKREVKKWGE